MKPIAHLHVVPGSRPEGSALLDSAVAVIITQGEHPFAGFPHGGVENSAGRDRELPYLSGVVRDDGGAEAGRQGEAAVARGADRLPLRGGGAGEAEGRQEQESGEPE
jgi:hypothetical protein